MGKTPLEGKLVRDRIPDIIREHGRQPVVSFLDRHDYGIALQAKLAEEAEELFGASAQHVTEELADVLEVLLAIAAERGVAWESVEHARVEKRRERGGFEGRTWLRT